MVKKYVAVNYSIDTQDMLRMWCIQNGFDLSVSYSGEIRNPEKFDFHTTVYYTSNDVIDRDYSYPNKIYKKTRVVGFDLFGESKNVPVLLVEKTAGLHLIRSHYTNLGFQDEWPEWKPHISLSYAPVFPDLSNLILPKFELIYDAVQVETIEDDL